MHTAHTHTQHDTNQVFMQKQAEKRGMGEVLLLLRSYLSV